ncbi:MAG: hypothetical protein LBH46_01445 [Rickettsiales bacterium]|jgi:hypothetical protein|nr:hypothetical protein [Rickettsiales bacterium]
MKTNIQVFVVMYIFFVLSSCHGQNSIIGKWFFENDADPMLLEFNETRLFSTDFRSGDIESISIKIENNRIISDEFVWAYEIQEQNLLKIIEDPDNNSIIASGTRVTDELNSLEGKWFFTNLLNEGTVILELAGNQAKIISVEYDDYYTMGYFAINGKFYLRTESFEYEFQGGNTLKLKVPETNIVFIGIKQEENYRKMSSLTGNYILVNDTGLYQSIEFVDEKYFKIQSVRMFNRTTTLSGEYEISGSNLILKISGHTFIFELISDAIIKGDTVGLGNISIFIKE